MTSLKRDKPALEIKRKPAKLDLPKADPGREIKKLKPVIVWNEVKPWA